MKEITIAANDAGQRLDKFITKYMPSLPTAMLYRGLRKKRIKVNGGKTDGAYRLCEGDVLQLYLNDEFFETPKKQVATPQAPELKVIYEDENILLADKPVGQLVHDDKPGQTDTAIAHIRAYLIAKGEYDPQKEQSFTPALCNRLDRNTSGIVIAAKNAAALREINAAVKERKVDKYYQCLAEGVINPPTGVLTGFLRKNAADNRMTVFDTQKPNTVKAVTAYRVMEQGDTRCRVEVELLTGRTHQIRAQFAHMGHPLCGDTKYGATPVRTRKGRAWQALCAYRVRFRFDETSPLSYLNGRDFCVEHIPF